MEVFRIICKCGAVGIINKAESQQGEFVIKRDFQEGEVTLEAQSYNFPSPWINVKYGKCQNEAEIDWEKRRGKMNKSLIIKELKDTFKEYAVATVVMHVDGIGKRAEVIKSPDMIIKYIDKNFNDSLVAYKNKNIILKSFEIRGWEKARVGL